MVLPIANSSRQTNVYDPKTGQWTLVDMCASSQHLMFAEDANNTLWFSNPGGDKVGWLNTKMYDETHDAEKSQGWTPFVLDTNGNGKRDEYVEPDQPIDPTKDMRIKVGFYAVSPSPADGSVWGTVLGFPGALVRLNPGSDPTKTSLAEIYEVPWNNPKAPVQGFSPRGMDIDSRRRDLDRARQRTLRQLRPPQVQGTAQRPHSHRPALPRRLDALSHARTELPRESTKDLAAPTRTITTGSINSTRSAWARTFRSPPRTAWTHWKLSIRQPGNSS